MKYKLVMFDFDGTLADSLPWVARVQNQVAEKFHLPRVEPAEYERLRGYDLKQILKQLNISPLKLPQVGSYVLRLMAEQIDQIRLFPGIDRLLPELVKTGVTLAVVSSNSRENVCQVLGPANTACIRYFECGVSLFAKAAKLRKVLRQSGTRPDEAILIGDEIRDLEAARAAHIASGAVSWGYNSSSALLALTPNIVFARVAEIAEKLA